MSPRTAELAQNLDAVRGRVARACEAVGRDPQEVTLIVVTKTFPADDVRRLADLGVVDVGENRDQEAAAKAAALNDLPDVRWHCIGRLQTNKARSVAGWATSVHSVDSTRLADALGTAVTRVERTAALDCLVQVSLDPQAPPGRGGVQPDGVAQVAERIAGTPGLRLAGVMAVAPHGVDPRPGFERLRRVSEELRREHPDAGWISAGMSGDLEEALTFGATHLRVGGAVLGNRPPLA